MANTRQNFPIAWAEDAGDNTDPGDPKTADGWFDEIPDYEKENFNQNKITEMLGHIEVNGIPVWDAATIYQIGAYSKGSDNLIYKSLQNANVNHDAISSPSWWALAFMDLTTVQTVTGEKTFDDLKLGANADANDKKIVNLATPTSNKDAANKAYIDGLIPTGLLGGNESIGETAIGELQLKWGQKSVGLDSQTTITFTTEGLTAFDNNCFQVMVVGDSTSIAQTAVAAGEFTATTFRITNSHAAQIVHWIAIGR